jgi:hypothetical protein
MDIVVEAEGATGGKKVLFTYLFKKGDNGLAERSSWATATSMIHGKSKSRGNEYAWDTNYYRTLTPTNTHTHAHAHTLTLIHTYTHIHTHTHTLGTTARRRQGGCTSPP